MLKHLDLFSGIGGFALAAKWVGGIETVAFSEIDPYCCKVLEKNFPGVKNYGDIRNVKEKDVWLLTGGFPCQPFSISGKRRGKEDDRYLWPEMFGVIREAKPTWIICENVLNFVNMEFEQTITDLESENYETQTFIVPAVSLDAPHQRKRVWIVAYSNGEGLEGWKEHWKNKSEWFSGKGSESNTTNWNPEPELGRVANGISNRMDRLKGLGNAIVPQIAKVIIETIKNVENF
jgi:DNA (cytosine-5)-methyltransferase 1